MNANLEQANFDVEGEGQPPYAPELYRPAAEARQARDLDSISDADLRFYDAQGYLSVAAAFTPGETGAALNGLSDLIMGTRPDFKGIVFESSAREILPTLGLEARQDAVRKLASFVEFDRRLHVLAYHPKLIAVLRTLLGDEPVLFQDMALLKPPRIGREKPWHQDMSYFNYDPGAKVVGVWVALDQATVENGCMQLLPGRHRAGPVIHFKRRDWQICDAEILGKTSVAAPLQPGGLLLFDGLLPHGTPHNASGRRRRALQFHYAGATTQKIAASERMRVFGSEGKDVSC
ncbi:MAG: phytanoyl-CoA dioxygenase family protein [Methylacidiphilales bacterium]|nr:phytanoyl-CoA dioxygenase family protein [Candidatus Methylacidiphilales bacterium]